MKKMRAIEDCWIGGYGVGDIVDVLTLEEVRGQVTDSMHKTYESLMNEDECGDIIGFVESISFGSIVQVYRSEMVELSIGEKIGYKLKEILIRMKGGTV